MGMMASKDKPLRSLKKHIGYCSECYCRCKHRLLTDDYDNRYFVRDVQRLHDLEYISNMNMQLEKCSKESNGFLRAYYFDEDGDKMYYESMPRTSYYRLQKKAIYEIADCLNI